MASSSRPIPARGKLVRCARGCVWEVAVDLRREPPTVGEWEAFELDDVHGHQRWIPVGFGHACCVLSDSADVVYECTAYYDAATEAAIRFDDPHVRIVWHTQMDPLCSERDRTAPSLAQIAASLQPQPLR